MCKNVAWKSLYKVLKHLQSHKYINVIKHIDAAWSCMPYSIPMKRDKDGVKREVAEDDLQIGELWNHWGVKLDNMKDM